MVSEPNKPCIDCTYSNYSGFSYPCNDCGFTHRNFKKAKSDIRPCDTQFTIAEQNYLIRTLNKEAVALREVITNALESTGILTRI